MKSRRLAFSLALILLTISGCQRANSPFTGKWLGYDGQLEIELFCDQTALLRQPNNYESGAASWMVLDDGRIKLDFSYRGDMQIITGILEDDKLVMTFDRELYTLYRAGADAAEGRAADQNEQSNPDEALLLSCGNNLKQIGLAMKMYANESRGEKYPPLSTKRGNFIMTPWVIHPEYLANTEVFYCPASEKKEPRRGIINNDSYWYFGYALHDEATGMAFLEAYAALPEGADYPDYFELKEELPNGLTQIHMLREGIERFLITDINDPRASRGLQSQIPLLVERPDNHGGGGNVLYLDGHVEVVPFPGKFPMTEAFIEGIRQIEAEQH